MVEALEVLAKEVGVFLARRYVLIPVVENRWVHSGVTLTINEKSWSLRVAGTALTGPNLYLLLESSSESSDVQEIYEVTQAHPTAVATVAGLVEVGQS